MAKTSAIGDKVREILESEIDRMHKKRGSEREGRCEACEQAFGLTDRDAAMLERLVKVDRLLFVDDSTSDEPPPDAKTLLSDLREPEKDADLFPKRGTKSTTKQNEP